MVINGTQEFFDQLTSFGVHIHYLGGETADVGDVVRTIAVNGTIAARWPKNQLITNEKITAGDVIIGLASDGQASYEQYYNSGIGSNGLTSARHDVLHKVYSEKFPDSFDNSLEDQVVYIGPHQMQDKIPGDPSGLDVGHLLLSPTRTYAPVLKVLLQEHFEKIHGLVHCSGGGQTKCMKYLPKNFRIIKDNLFEAPLIFQLIQQASGSDNREMYQVFNMGHRMEIFCRPEHAQSMIEVSQGFGIHAQIVGRVEESSRKELILKLGKEEIIY